MEKLKVLTVFVFIQMDPVVVKAIDHHSVKLTLSSGMQDTFQIHKEFTLHYSDEDFGSFFAIHSAKVVKHEGSRMVLLERDIVQR